MTEFEVSRQSEPSGREVHEPYDVVLAPAARTTVADRLPESIALAVIEFLTGPLPDNPHRVGKALRGELSGLSSARLGSYRVIYRIDDRLHEVYVLRIDHRSRAYRT